MIIDLESFDDILAMRVLGWHYCKSTFEQYEPSFWADDKDRNVWGSDFRPTLFMKDASALFIDGMTLSFSLTQGSYSVWASRTFSDGKMGNSAVRDSSLPLALCRAVAEVFGIEVPMREAVP